MVWRSPHSDYDHNGKTLSINLIIQVGPPLSLHPFPFPTSPKPPPHYEGRDLFPFFFFSSLHLFPRRAAVFSSQPKFPCTIVPNESIFCIAGNHIWFLPQPLGLLENSNSNQMDHKCEQIVFIKNFQLFPILMRQKPSVSMFSHR